MIGTTLVYIENVVHMAFTTYEILFRAPDGELHYIRTDYQPLVNQATRYVTCPIALTVYPEDKGLAPTLSIVDDVDDFTIAISIADVIELAIDQLDDTDGYWWINNEPFPG